MLDLSLHKYVLKLLRLIRYNESQRFPIQVSTQEHRYEFRKSPKVNLCIYILVYMCDLQMITWAISIGLSIEPLMVNILRAHSPISS